MRLDNFKIEESDAPLIEKLQKHHRDVLNHGGSYEQMAADLGIPEGTARSRLHRARKALIELRVGAA